MIPAYVYESLSVDPYYNLAVEQYLLETAKDCVILYLWQNQNTVVIGRNQNPWKECKTALLEQEGGHLARRLSGGGAVFHDLGNLNFTLLLPQDRFDLTRQFAVIMDAVASFGVPVTLSGRNDILADGRKCSGNAFYKNGKQAYHHGTLLVNADMEKMGRYLSPSKAKLQSKGVDSVRSRVTNLASLNPAINIDSLKTALTAAFGRVYGPVQRLTAIDESAVAQLAARNRSWEWNYGQRLPFTMELQQRFPWGSLELQLQVENGVIQQIKAYSDAMDWALAPIVENALTGCRLARGDMETAIEACGDLAQGKDIMQLFQAL